MDIRNAARGSPEWWLVRLLQRLEADRHPMERYQRYYDGDQPMAIGDDAFREAFGQRFRRFSSNFIALVVDGLAERLEVQGFRFLDPRGDADLWDIWQANDLDGGSQVVHTDAIVKGQSYALVEPVRDGLPIITVEDALDCTVEADPRDRTRRLAGLKRWVDEDGRLVVNVYTPERLYRYRSVQAWPDHIEGWPASSMVAGSTLPAGGFDRFTLPDEEWGMEHGMSRVPLVPLVNRPDVRGHGRSEVAVITSQQDAINYYRTAMVIAARYMAVPQRWVIGLDVGVDPDTGRPKRPFVTASGRPADLWVIDNPELDEPPPPFPPQFGQFEAADLSVFVKAIEAEIAQMAAISRMPFSELLGQPSSIPQSGEGLKSSESSLLRKTGKAQIHFGEGWEEVMRVALDAMHDERADLRIAETLWVSPETRNEAVRTDAVVKQLQAQIIDTETAAEALGYTPAQIARIKERRAAMPQPQPTDIPGPVPPPAGPRMTPVL